MKKGGTLVFTFSLIIILSLSPIFAESTVDNEIKKLTHYAEDYETGNINYVQFLLYSSAVRARLNEIIGAVSKEEGGLLEEEQIKSALGEPNEWTKWAWVEKEERETKLDKEVPIWRKIVFDGKKIQIRLSAHPSIFKKENFKEVRDEKLMEEEDFFGENEEKLVYRLNFETEFKRPEEQLDINSKISSIKELAASYNSDPSQGNAEALAKESVNIERTFESYFRQNPENCEKLMNSIFGSENKREIQKVLVQEVEFYEGENFEAKLRLEMCDDCEWYWINMNMWVEGRGPEFKPPKGRESDEQGFEGKFKQMDTEEFKTEAKKLIAEMKSALERGDYEQAMTSSQTLQKLTEVWNEKANNVWEQVQKEFDTNQESMTEEERRECDKTYCWIKKEQEKRNKVKEIAKGNYEERKGFYLDLFADYNKKEFYFEQQEWEERLVQEFKEFGKEVCDNGQDDNGNGNLDCADEQCGGKFCGQETVEVTDDNETKQEVIEMYCISGTCQAKEEIVQEEMAVCGNHVCEENETQTCAEDCLNCAIYEPLECNGAVFFSGTDESGCPLEPVCLEDKEVCESKEDCTDPLCGSADCVEGMCQVGELGECRDAECVDGEEKIARCSSGNEIISEKCIEGLWKETGISCGEEDVGEVVVGVLEEREIVGEECNVKGDCGNENDVCSNGRCITIPQVIQVEEDTEEREITDDSGEAAREESEEREETTESEEPMPEASAEPEAGSTIVGEVIFSLPKAAINMFSEIFLKNFITGHSVEGGGDGSGGDSGQEGGSSNEGTTQTENEEPMQSPEENQPQQEERREYQEDDGDRERREREDKERRGKECNENCERECSNRLIRPCAEECIWEQCGDELECDIDEERVKCENKCNEEKDIEGCASDCSEKCKEGEDWGIKEERRDEEHKEEKGVFKAGGSCRTAQQKTEGFIFFDGWGEPFEDIRNLKYKYYQGGEADWCKYDLENLKKQRKEFEQGFNEEFVRWFFENYLANSAEDWEEHVSGIFELYWKDVDISRESGSRAKCLGINEVPEHNLINVQYETDYGKLKFWEELKSAKLHGANEETQLISPYMEIWIFPSKEVMKSMFRKAMEKQEMPGPEDEKAGPSEEEKGEIRKDDAAMKELNKIIEKYDGRFDGAIQFKDFETNEVVFNLYVKIDEENLVEVTPMLYEEVPEEDARAELDFELLYDIIHTSEKEIRGAELESPPWDKKPRTGKIKEITNGVKMWWKGRQLLNSAKYYPASSKPEMQMFLKEFFTGMMGGPENGEENIAEEEMNNEEKPEAWEDQKTITGETIKI